MVVWRVGGWRDVVGQVLLDLLVDVLVDLLLLLLDLPAAPKD